VLPRFRTDLAAIELLQQRLKVEQVDVTGTAPHKQKNDSFGKTWTVWQSRRNRVGRSCLGCQSGEADVRKSAGRRAQQTASRCRLPELMTGLHVEILSDESIQKLKTAGTKNCVAEQSEGFCLAIRGPGSGYFTRGQFQKLLHGQHVISSGFGACNSAKGVSHQ
jgi:hypothetical protein